MRYCVSMDQSSQTLQKIVDGAPEAEKYCTDGYSGYLDVVFPGKHIYTIHYKRDTFTVEGVNADLRCCIPTLARRGEVDVFRENWNVYGWLSPFLSRLIIV